MNTVDTNICPLCGELNLCGVSQPETCWCRSETFAQELLDRVPPKAVNQACICQRCVTEAVTPQKNLQAKGSQLKRSQVKRPKA